MDKEEVVKALKKQYHKAKKVGDKTLTGLAKKVMSKQSSPSQTALLPLLGSNILRARVRDRT